uniref:VPS37D subunit of ESCRT-I n=1 Tax=Erpetoichthys calabaricus TaxID=27687 RepID=A0A8C4SC20_ERPCA
MFRLKRGKNPVQDGFNVLSTSQLRDLLQDESKMEQIVRLSQKFQELQEDRDTILLSNRSLAEKTLSHQPEFDNGKLKLADKYQELEQLMQSCRGKQERLDAYMEKRSLQAAQTLLQSEVDQAEQQSEKLLEQFMDGSLALEDFLESFQKSRKVCHIRRAQSEKAQELGRQDRNLRRLCHPDDTRTTEQESTSLNSCPIQAPPRVYQVRYGLTPAILVPSFPLPSAPGSGTSTNLPPLSVHTGHPQVFRPGSPTQG